MQYCLWCRLVVATLLAIWLGGCGLAHGIAVQDVALKSCPVPPGGKRLKTDDLWTVMWNQKTFNAEVRSPLPVAATRDVYVQYLQARGWRMESEHVPEADAPLHVLDLRRGTPWGELIRWDCQMLTICMYPAEDDACTVKFDGWFEYAPLTWPRYLVQQGLGCVLLPLWPLALVDPGGEAFRPFVMPFVAGIVVLF
jgi:hypothetical protein